MSTTIKLKNGSGAPLAGDLVQGEPALDLTNKRLYTENASGTVIEVGTNPTSLTTGTFTSTGIDDNATSTAITIDASENVGIGTASPQFQLHLSGSAPGVVMSETGAVKYYRNRAAASALTWDILNTDYSFNSEVMRIDSSGNVGIGETAPSRALDIKSANPLNINTTSNNQIHFQVNDVTTGQYSSSSSLPHQLCDSTGSLSRLVVDASGNVGIGTTSPEFGIHYVSGTSGNTTVLGSGDELALESSGDVGMTFRGGTGNFATMYFAFPSDTYRGFIQYSEADDYLGFGTAKTERMRIDSSGNVGIGTSSPSSTASAGPTLEISGTAGGNLVLSDSNATSGQRAKYLLSQGGALYVGHSADDGTSPVNDLVVDSSGEVGIGTTSPSTSLDVVRAGAQPFRLESTSGTECQINMVNTGGNVQLEAHSGNFNIDATYVGINKTSPQQALDVFGGIRLSASGTDANRYNVYWNGATGDLILVSSDARLKKDFDYDIAGIETVNKLKPVRYTWKEDNKRQLGFTAQESFEADEHLAWNDTENDRWGLDGWEGYAAVLTKAIQEQQVMIEELKAEVAALKGA